MSGPAREGPLPPEDGERVALAEFLEELADECPSANMVESYRRAAALLLQPLPPPAAGVSKAEVLREIEALAGRHPNWQRLYEFVEALPEAAPHEGPSRARQQGSNSEGGLSDQTTSTKQRARAAAAFGETTAPPSGVDRKGEKRERGLYHKFNVSRTDGASEEGEKHYDCEYFVLDLSHDPHAFAALFAYADACERGGYARLAEDLRKRAARGLPGGTGAPAAPPPGVGREAPLTSYGYGLLEADGSPHWTECCVAADAALLLDGNDGEIEEAGLRVVRLWWTPLPEAKP